MTRHFFPKLARTKAQELSDAKRRLVQLANIISAAYDEEFIVKKRIVELRSSIR